MGSGTVDLVFPAGRPVFPQIVLRAYGASFQSLRPRRGWFLRDDFQPV